VATLRVADGEFTVRVGDEEWSMPADGDIRVLLDGPVLAVSTRSGVLGTAITPGGDTFVVHPPVGRIQVHELARR
jgi:beta-fructofuranosidase